MSARRCAYPLACVYLLQVATTLTPAPIKDPPAKTGRGLPYDHKAPQRSFTGQTAAGFVTLYREGRAPSVYERLSNRSPVALAAAQSFVLASASDATSQTMHGVLVSWQHVAAMATCASILSGGLNAMWLAVLERQFPGTNPRAVFLKSACDFLLCAPVVNSLYLCGVPFLTALYCGTDPDVCISILAGGWTQEAFVSAMLLNLCTFQPYNLLQFAVVPLRYRPLGGACVSATATVVLSSITLGF